MNRMPAFFAAFSLMMLLFCACASESETELSPVELLSSVSVRLENADDLDPLIERAGENRLVLLGEASHGTSEFYSWRSDISRRLVSEKSFNFIAVEGDWAGLYRLNEYVKGLNDQYSSARAIMKDFDRWPRWMWANEEVEELIEWLRAYNADRPPEERVGFYGMDVYGTENSYRMVLELADGLSEEIAGEIGAAYECLREYADDFGQYARAAASGTVTCERQVQEVVRLLRERRDELNLCDRAFFNLKQNALVVKNAERHFRGMSRHGADSWNYRVDHFFHTVRRLLEHYGPDARGVAWAHNTHIGDARATTMAAGGQRNIGQIAREQLGAGHVFAVGFGTHRGTVMAGRAWGGAAERMNVPRGIAGSYEDIMNRIGKGDVLMMLDDLDDPEPLMQPVGHRAIGVVYHPERERGNYVPTILTRRYNAFIFIDETQSVRPIH